MAFLVDELQRFLATVVKAALVLAVICAESALKHYSIE